MYNFYSGSHIPIKYRQTEATQHGNTNSSGCNKTMQKPLISSRYNNCVLLLSPVGLRIFSQQMTTLQLYFISHTCSVHSRLSESHADDQLRLMDLIIIYLKYLSG